MMKMAPFCRVSQKAALVTWPKIADIGLLAPATEGAVPTRAIRSESW